LKNKQTQQLGAEIQVNFNLQLQVHISQWYFTGIKSPPYLGGAICAWWGRFCDLPDSGAISVSREAMSAL